MWKLGDLQIWRRLMAEAAPAAAFPRHTGVPEEDDDTLESFCPDFPLGFWRPGSPAEKNQKTEA